MRLALKNLKLYGEPVDFRKSINGLLIELSSIELFKFEPEVGYIFFNNDKNKLKLLYREQQGFCIWHKRLDGRGFKLQDDLPKLSSINEEHFCGLRSGLDLRFSEKLFNAKKLVFN